LIGLLFITIIIIYINMGINSWKQSQI